MAAGDRKDPYAQFNFLVEIDGVTVAGFTEVSGLNAESDSFEYRLGSEPPTMRKIPGLLKFTNITLKRGYTDSRELWTWRKATLDGQTKRRSGSIVLLNEARQEALRWNFREGWLVKYDGPALNSKTNDAAVETIEIVHEGLELVE
jgi:phage tail-like protein